MADPDDRWTRDGVIHQIQGPGWVLELLEERYREKGGLYRWATSNAPQLDGIQPDHLRLVALPRDRLRPEVYDYMCEVLDDADGPGMDIDAIRAVARWQGRSSTYAELPDLDEPARRYDVVVVVASVQ